MEITSNSLNAGKKWTSSLASTDLAIAADSDGSLNNPEANHNNNAYYVTRYHEFHSQLLTKIHCPFDS